MWRFDESAARDIGYTSARVSVAGETNDRIFASIWQCFAVAMASSVVMLLGVAICNFHQAGLVFVGTGAACLVYGLVTTYWVVDCHLEDARAEREARHPKPQPISGDVWRAPFPPPPFVERVYTQARDGRVPTVNAMRGEFPTAQDYFAQMAKAGAIVGRTERGDGGTLVWTLERALDAARFANPGYAPSANAE